MPTVDVSCNIRMAANTVDVQITKLLISNDPGVNKSYIGHSYSTNFPSG